MASIKSVLLQVLCYADIFDYPLTKDELFWFAQAKISSVKVVAQALLSLQSPIAHEQGFYFLKGREGLAALRKRRQEISKKKEALARILGGYFSQIPTVEFVGISGGVAAGNAEGPDDIDFFLITKPHAIWTTRFIILIWLHLIGRRRARGARNVEDMACINMFLDARNLLLPPHMRNLYTAHEIVNMLPVFSRGDTYQAFLQANAWVFSLLPQARKKMATYQFRTKPQSRSLLLQLLEKNAVVQLSRFLQRTYMRRKKEESLITDSLVAFYPRTFGPRVLDVYKENLDTVGIKEK